MAVPDRAKDHPSCLFQGLLTVIWTLVAASPHFLSLQSVVTRHSFLVCLSRETGDEKSTQEVSAGAVPCFAYYK